MVSSVQMLVSSAASDILPRRRVVVAVATDLDWTLNISVTLLLLRYLVSHIGVTLKYGLGVVKVIENGADL